MRLAFDNKEASLCLFFPFLTCVCQHYPSCFDKISFSLCYRFGMYDTCLHAHHLSVCCHPYEDLNAWNNIWILKHPVSVFMQFIWYCNVIINYSLHALFLDVNFLELLTSANRVQYLPPFCFSCNTKIPNVSRSLHRCCF